MFVIAIIMFLGFPFLLFLIAQPVFGIMVILFLLALVAGIGKRDHM